MTIFNPPKFVTRSLMGAVGLSAIAFLAVPEAAKALSFAAGTDYLQTLPGTFSEIPGIGLVDLMGVPKGPFGSSTVVERGACEMIPNTDSCQATLLMTHLSLKSVNPVSIPGVPDLVDIHIGLSPNELSTGLMTITEEPDGSLTFTQDPFNVYYTVTPKDPITGEVIDPPGTFEPVPGPGQEYPINFNMGGGIGERVGDDGFVVVQFDEQALTARHRGRNVTIPEPSTTLGLLFLGLGSVASLKRRDKANK